MGTPSKSTTAVPLSHISGFDFGPGFLPLVFDSCLWMFKQWSRCSPCSQSSGTNQSSACFSQPAWYFPSLPHFPFQATPSCCYSLGRNSYCFFQKSQREFHCNVHKMSSVFPLAQVSGPHLPIQLWLSTNVKRDEAAPAPPKSS